jgi:hypothetical protein
MINKQDNCQNNYSLVDIMEQCSRQCIRRTLYGVMIGVSPIIICLLLIALARLIIHRLETSYYRRQKVSDRRSSFVPSPSGRLALSYTPVSNAELQRIIQGDHQSQQLSELSSAFVYNNNSNVRKAPKFIKSLLPRREALSPSASILANLVMRRDVMDASPITGVLAPISSPLQPTFSIVNEQERRRPSVITITRESVETTTLATMNNNGNDFTESEQQTNDPLMAASKTMTTTTTVVVEEFLDYHSVKSLPCALTLLNSVSENDYDKYSEIDKENEE